MGVMAQAERWGETGEIVADVDFCLWEDSRMLLRAYDQLSFETQPPWMSVIHQGRRPTTIAWRAQTDKNTTNAAKQWHVLETCSLSVLESGRWFIRMLGLPRTSVTVTRSYYSQGLDTCSRLDAAAPEVCGSEEVVDD